MQVKIIIRPKSRNGKLAFIKQYEKGLRNQGKFSNRLSRNILSQFITTRDKISTDENSWDDDYLEIIFKKRAELAKDYVYYIVEELCKNGCSIHDLIVEVTEI